MARKKEKVEAIEVVKPKTVKKRKGDKYNVLIPFSIGIGEGQTDYKKGDTIYLQSFEAKQFINTKKIKKC